MQKFIKTCFNCFLCFFFVLVLGVDRVFRGDCSTKQVYEDEAKEIVLSVVSGINYKYGVSIVLSVFRSLLDA